MKGSWLAADDTALGISAALDINQRDIGHGAVALDCTRDSLRLAHVEMSVGIRCRDLKAVILTGVE